MTLTEKLTAYEQGDLTEEQTVAFFQEMLDTGLVWKLQGHYGRTASALIQDGWIDSDGAITEKAELNGLT